MKKTTHVKNNKQEQLILEKEGKGRRLFIKEEDLKEQRRKNKIN